MKKLLTPFLVVVLIMLLSITAYYYNKITTFKKDPQAKAQAEVRKETDELVGIVGKLIVLPQGETPTIATVTDPEKLKEQLFFSKTTVGDKVLIYGLSKKAYLYSPSKNKVLEVAPIAQNAPVREQVTPVETTASSSERVSSTTQTRTN
jgi:hypothetical protein